MIESGSKDQSNFTDQMFDTNFYDSFKRIQTHSQVSDSYPFIVASKVYEQNSSVLAGDGNGMGSRRGSIMNQYKQVQKKKRIEDYDLEELVQKFLSKDVSSLSITENEAA